MDCPIHAEPVQKDYGIDVNLYTLTPRGELEAGFIPIQVKATESPRYVSRGTMLTQRLEKADVHTWLEEPYPVILVVYDVLNTTAPDRLKPSCGLTR